MHAAFLGVGVDVVETPRFGGFGSCSTKYGIAERAHELNVAAARLAREVADGYDADGRPRCVAGSIGPGTKLAAASATSRFAEPARRATRCRRAACSKAASTCS